MEIALKEGLKIIYGSPKSIRGEKSPRKHLSESHLRSIYLRWFKTILYSWILLKSGLMTESRTLDKGWGRRITNIYKNYYLHIKSLTANFLTALMWRWYLNSERAALQLVVKSSKRCEMRQEEASRIRLHVYGNDGTKIVVYNIRRSKKGKDKNKK